MGVNLAANPRRGWGWPALSKKAHYFDDSPSCLCGGWLYAGGLEAGNDGSPDNCKACQRRLAKLREDERPHALRRYFWEYYSDSGTAYGYDERDAKNYLKRLYRRVNMPAGFKIWEALPGDDYKGAENPEVRDIMEKTRIERPEDWEPPKRRGQ